MIFCETAFTGCKRKTAFNRSGGQNRKNDRAAREGGNWPRPSQLTGTSSTSGRGHGGGGSPKDELVREGESVFTHLGVFQRIACEVFVED